MKTRTQTQPPRTRRRLNRRPRIAHHRVNHDPGSAAYLTTSQGKSFIDGCLQAVVHGNWGLISNSESEANNRAPVRGHIQAAFLVPDQLDTEQVLLIDVTNIGTRHSRTTVRVLDPSVVSP